MKTNDKYYASIVTRLSRTRDAFARRQAVEGAVNVVSFFACFAFSLWFMTIMFWPAPAFRMIALICGAAGAAYLATQGVVRPLVARLPLAGVALRLEKVYGKLQSRLIASLQLYDKLSANKENYSVELIEKTIEDAGQEIKDLDFSVAVEKKKTPFQRLAFAVAAVALASLISGKVFSQVALLYANPFSHVSRPSSLILSLSPREYQAIKNDDVTVKVIATGEKVRQVDLEFKFEDGKWVSAATEKIPDQRDADTLFTYTFHKLKRDVQYFARARDTKSSLGRITVIDPPNLLDISVTLDFPAYTGLKDQKLPSNDGSITAVKGTKAAIRGKASKPVRAAFLVLDDSTRREMTIQSDLVSGQFDLKKNGSYSIELVDLAGLENPNPIAYNVVCLEDYAPQVNITFPAVDIDLDERMTVPIEAALFDDFGFSKLELVFWTLSEGKESSKSRLTLSSKFDPVTEAGFSHDWYIEDLHLLPGDLVYYYLELFDNDVISGPKSGMSKTYSARLPGLDEIMADITGSQDQMFKEFEETIGSQKALKDEIEQLSRDMKQLSDVDWEKRQQIQSTLDRQKEIAAKLDQVASQMDEMIEKFEKNELATLDMMDKLEQLRDLLEEVATPELKEAMKKLQEALQNMDPELLRQAMENFQLSVEQINENLDRMLALLEKYQLEQKLDTMAKMAEKLAEQQQQINDKLGQCNSSKEVSDLQKPQEQQAEGLQNLRQQLDETQRLNDKTNAVSPQDMQQADNMVNSRALDQAMQEMLGSLGMCNKQNAGKHGSQLQQNFSDMASLFQQMLQKMQSDQLAKISGMIRKAIADILYLSNNQEEIIDSVQAALKRLEADGRHNMASDQQDIETATSRTAEHVSDITKETLFVNYAVMERLGAAINKMREAVGQLNSHFPGKAKSDQIEAMAALNKSVEMLMNAMDQVSQCQNSGTGMQSFMEQLGKLGQQQQMLNQQTQMMMPLPGQMMNMAQQQALQRLAAQQEAVRKSLQQLLDEYANSDAGNVLGRLDELAGEMKKVSEELQNQNVDRRTVERQERILSRLLDAEKSVHRRDYSRQRQARPGEDTIRRGPGSLSSGSAVDEKLAEDIKKALSEKYPHRYETQIKEYFKALGEDGQHER